MRNSRWTQIYWGATEGRTGLFPFVRLVPNFMDTEAAGASHGIALGHGPCENEEAANKYADSVDRFMDKMLEAISEDQAEVIKGLMKIATGENNHVFAGLCPDGVEGFSSRDEECEACGLIEKAEALIKEI